MNNKIIFNWQNGKGDYLEVVGDKVGHDLLHNGRETFNTITIKMNDVEYIIKGCAQCHELFIAENLDERMTEDDD